MPAFHECRVSTTISNGKLSSRRKLGSDSACLKFKGSPFKSAAPIYVNAIVCYFFEIIGSRQWKMKFIGRVPDRIWKITINKFRNQVFRSEPM